MKEKFDWSEYISNLQELPPLTQYSEKELVHAIKTTIPKKPGLTILEVGCANGRWLRWFAKEYDCDGYGIDLSTKGFARDINPIRGDAFNLPYKDDSFDVVYSFGVIEHFQKQYRRKILEEHVRVLFDGGFLICALPNLYFSLEFFWVKYFYDYKQGYQHFVVKPTELKQVFDEFGLDVKHFSYIGVFRELSFLKKVKHIAPFNRVLSGEMLYICRK